VEVLGIARGNTVRARNVGRDITQGLRNLAGGELTAYSTLLADTRDQAIDAFSNGRIRDPRRHETVIDRRSTN
jgi:uncharacterized protein YbjQ (UPF0145 family)